VQRKVPALQFNFVEHTLVESIVSLTDVSIIKIISRSHHILVLTCVIRSFEPKCFLQKVLLHEMSIFEKFCNLRLLYLCV